MILDSTNNYIQTFLGGAVATNELAEVADWVDITSSGFTPGHSQQFSSGAVVVNLVVGPAAGTIRVIKLLNFHNRDTAAATITVRCYYAGILMNLVVVTLQPADTLQWTPETGWQVLTSSGAWKTVSAQYPGYQQKGITILTAGSSYTVPAGVRALLVECQAGGGGGGGAGGIATGAAAGGGGASGGRARKLLTSLKASYAYSIGAAGVAGADTGGDGGAGGDTTFDSPSVCTAKGGLGGKGMPGINGVQVAAGGGPATSGLVGDEGNYGHAGQAGINVSGALFLPGHGGSSAYGSGGAAVATTRQAGAPAVGYGGGGAGGGNLNNATGMGGGAGSAGCIVLTEFY